MISGLFVYNHKGDCIISRIYRDDITRSAVDLFKVHVIHSRSSVRSPIHLLEKTTYCHVKRNNMWLVACTRQFLGKFIELMESYFHKFLDINVKNNFALIYELLDEILDFGYPQSTDPEALKMFITQAGTVISKTKEEAQKITSQVTGQIGWRRDGIKYRKHEIYLDVLESVSLLMSPTGQVLSSHVSGSIRMKCYLSGMPECKFGINDKLASQQQRQPPPGSKKGQKKQAIALDDLTFHQCVKLGKFDNDRSISFIPPDGEYELMKYRTTQGVLLPFKVTPLIRESQNKIDITVTLKADFDAASNGEKIEVIVPLPGTTSHVHTRTDKGKAKFKSGSNTVLWKIKKIAGGRTATLTVEIDLLNTQTKKKWAKPPLSVNFEVQFACSGLQVKYLKILEPKLNYNDSQVTKWVRYISTSGHYEIRLP